MCGIAGKIYFNEQKIDPQREVPLIKKTLKKLHHRGPDDQGYIVNDNVWLAATRLSIIDLSYAGHQPMINENKTVFLVCNGEIYNYKELKKRFLQKHKFVSKTDTEVILHLYEEKGFDCLNYLRGFFALAIYDTRKKILFLARDRIGKKPLKYFYNDKLFIFASELKAFIDHPGILKEIDWGAVDEFLKFQYVPSPKTGFKNIWKLPPAHYMLITSVGKISKKRYWDQDFSKKLDLSKEEWQERIIDKLNQSIRLRLQSDVSLGIHLSGGIDSGLITALASIQSRKKLRTFSIGFKESEYNELPFARLIAQKYKTDHHELLVKEDILDLLSKMVYQYEEPFADPSILPTWLLMKESKKYMTVSLNGDGGDENFAGYRRYQLMNYFNLIKKIPFKKNLSNLFGYAYYCFHIKDLSQTKKCFSLPYSPQNIFYQEIMSFIDNKTKNNLFAEDFKKTIIQSRSGNLLKELINKKDQYELIDRFLYTDIHTYLPDCLLYKNDIASMAHSIETRSPLLDHEFMELTAQMPSKFKLRGFQNKYLLKKLARKYLPQETFRRRKQGFVPPLEHWFRGKYYDYLKEELLEQKILQLNIFKEKELINLIDDHKKYRANNAYILWTILVLKNWIKTW